MGERKPRASLRRHSSAHLRSRSDQVESAHTLSINTVKEKCHHSDSRHPNTDSEADEIGSIRPGQNRHLDFSPDTKFIVPTPFGIEKRASFQRRPSLAALKENASRARAGRHVMQRLESPALMLESEKLARENDNEIDDEKNGDEIVGQDEDKGDVVSDQSSIKVSEVGEPSCIDSVVEQSVEETSESIIESESYCKPIFIGKTVLDSDGKQQSRFGLNKSLNHESWSTFVDSSDAEVNRFHRTIIEQTHRNNVRNKIKSMAPVIESRRWPSTSSPFDDAVDKAPSHHSNDSHSHHKKDSVASSLLSSVCAPRHRSSIESVNASCASHETAEKDSNFFVVRAKDADEAINVIRSSMSADTMLYNTDPLTATQDSVSTPVTRYKKCRKKRRKRIQRVHDVLNVLTECLIELAVEDTLSSAESSTVELSELEPSQTIRRRSLRRRHKKNSSAGDSLHMQ